MAIIKDVTVKINNGTATLDTPVQFYEKDHDVKLRFKLMDYKYKYDKDPQNILNSVDEDILEAYTTIVNPRGHELEQINGVVKNDTVIFRLDPTYTDELDEVGTYILQIHIKCTCSEFTIPPITFEVLERLKGIKVVTDGEDEVDNSEILDNSSKFVSDETGKLIIEWKKGDMISSAKLNAMVDVINDAVDEEAIRQANEIERQANEIDRQEKVNNKIQELEDTRVEYINKIDTELDSFADQVDASMTDYETRFNALTSKQQQDAEVIDARDGEVSLKARLDRDIEKAKQVYVNVEGSNISTDSSSGYAKDVEIKGNTVQDASNLADIRSVGDKVEGQELYKIDVVSCGKNLFIDAIYKKADTNGWSPIIKIDKTKSYVCKYGSSVRTPYIRFFDESLKIIPLDETFSKSGRVIKSASYFSIQYVNSLTNIQLEEGTQATPYEPYKEDKLTILSPVQLEKVGDVADRIICKDGVWGVEKLYQHNWDNISLEADINQFDNDDLTGKYNVFRLMKSQYSLIEKGIYPFFRLNGSFAENFKPYDGECVWGDGAYLYFKILKGKTTLDEFKAGKSFDFIVLSDNPQFIPLPHDQQIKLRTFANKTNISFLTEIEGTIKAQVPKSIGATVNTHTEQINNLNKELDRVKKLEESTVSTVTTESGFTTVEETGNGYFEDVKLEGRTLVNLGSNLNNWRVGSDSVNGVDYTVTTSNTSEIKVNKLNVTNGYMFLFKKIDVGIFKPNTTYTIVANTNDVSSLGIISTNATEIIMHPVSISNGLNIIKFSSTDFSTITGIKEIGIYSMIDNNKVSSNISASNVIILEGDHSQNPPEYFEGLKSVGQSASEDGADEIVVSSVNENLFDINSDVRYTSKVYEKNKCILSYEEHTTKMEVVSDKLLVKFAQWRGLYFGVWLKPNTSYEISFDKSGDIYSNLINGRNTKIVTTDSKGKAYWLSEPSRNGTMILSNIMVKEANINTNKYIPHQSNKKPLLYYNPTTETWEKPILRQWDSIEKHSDGKYYYHKRSEEVVLNGSGDHIYNNYGTNFNGSCISFRVTLKNITPKNGALCISDYGFILNSVPTQISEVFNDEYIHFMNNGNLYLTIQKDKLTSLDSAGVSALFTKNPIKLVFELDQEEVYECTNIDLITYQNETNYIINAGAIAPKSTLKVMSNISNVVRELQQKVSNLENYIQHVMIDALNNALDE